MKLSRSFSLYHLSNSITSYVLKRLLLVQIEFSAVYQVAGATAYRHTSASSMQHQNVRLKDPFSCIVTEKLNQQAFAKGPDRPP
jgi:hypothetical protein